MKETLIQQKEREKLPKPPEPPQRRTISESYFDAGKIPVNLFLACTIAFVIISLSFMFMAHKEITAQKEQTIIEKVENEISKN